MKYIALCILLFGTSYRMYANNSKDKKEILRILKSVDSSVARLSSVEYSITAYVLNSFENDTSIRQGHCVLKFMPKDPNTALYNVSYTISNSSKGRLYEGSYTYDGDWMHDIHRDMYGKESIKLKEIKDKSYDYLSDANSRSYIPHFFCDKTFFQQYYKKNKNYISIEELVWEQIPCYKIQMDRDKDDWSENIKYITYIRKSDLLPVGFFEWFSMGGVDYYDGWQITYERLNPNLKDSVFTIDAANITPTPEEPENKNSMVKEGMQAPDFKAILTDSTHFQLSALSGKVVVLDFWYISCIPCMQALPRLGQLHEKYKDKDIVFVGINPYNEAKDITKTLSVKGVQYPSTYLSKEITELYGLSSFPTMLIIDPKGNIFKIFDGWGPRSEKELIKVLDSFKK